MAAPTIFSRYLAALGVPHTESYSDDEFRRMTFKSLYGLSHLLSSYGVENEGLKFGDKSEIASIPTPFLAQTTSGIFVIVLAINASAGTVEYDSLDTKQKIDIASFIKVWNGVVLIAVPDKNSREPDYAKHRFTEFVASFSKYALVATFLAAFAYLFATRHIYAHFSTIMLAVFDCVGLYFSFMLLQKSLNIHTAMSDRVCGVLEQGGCDSVLQLSVSKLFGVFSWSEVGFGYFGVSLAALLMFPELWPALALCNICCLPYTFWSIWYQKFRAHHWCTLCVGVQSTLWLLFFCYLGGGWLCRARLDIHFLMLLDVYVFAVLFLNLILRIFKNLPKYEKDS